MLYPFEIFMFKVGKNGHFLSKNQPKKDGFLLTDSEIFTDRPIST